MIADPRIQLAKPDDAVEVAEMSRVLIESGLPWNWRPARMASAIAASDTNVAIARDHDVLVGFGIMEY